MKHVMNYAGFFVCISVCVLLGPPGYTQETATREQILKSWRECENDLGAAQQEITRLSEALKTTDMIFAHRKSAADSLILNLKEQLKLQDAVTGLMKANADTLQLMVRDYSQKLDEVNKLYLDELRKQARPWFLTGNGLKGAFYGLFIGGALGVTFAVLN